MSELKIFLKQTVFYGLSSVVARILNFLLVPLYTSIFIPEQYGVVSEMYAYAVFLMIFSTLTIETAFFKFSNEMSNKKDVASTSSLLLLITSIFFIILAIFFTGFISEIIGGNRAEEYQNYIFYFLLIISIDTLCVIPFAQLRKGDANVGTGLGLPLTRSMIEDGHNGSLDISSKGIGHGSSAKITVELEYSIVQKAKKVQNELYHWLKFKQDTDADVLVVDDSGLNRLLTCRTCDNNGLTHHEAKDGKEALELLKQNTYTLVCMDNQMPLMDGIPCIIAARAHGYTGAIAMVSGDTFSALEKNTNPDYPRNLAKSVTVK